MSKRKRYKKLLMVLLAVCLIMTVWLPTTGAQPDDNPELWKVVQPLETIVSFMNTGAHPDDEFSALLAYMSLGNGVRTSSVIANRGEGGQNEIGDELGDGLGIIRTRELEEASKVTNVDLFLLSQTLSDEIYDFGFSKSPEETLGKWGEELTYERLIRVIREQRPDILYPSFRDVPTQHGHHRAISQLTVRAFHDAADPSVFPQHLEEGLALWQPRKLYLPGTSDEETLRFNIGEIDRVYGKTYPQLGEDSRYLHKSQGMGRDLPIEDYFVSLYLQESVVGSGNEETIFDNLPYDFAAYAEHLESDEWQEKLIDLQTSLDSVVDAYPNATEVLHEAQQTLRKVRNLIDQLEKDASGLSQEDKVDLTYRLQVKEEQLQQVSLQSSGVTFTLVPEHGQLTRGATTEVTLTVTNNGFETLSEITVEPVIPDGWEVVNSQPIRDVQPGETITTTFTINVTQSAALFLPYEQPDLQAKISYQLLEVPLEQTISPVDSVAVLPDFGLQISPEGAILNTEKSEQEIPVDVKVTNYVDGVNEGQIRLNVPDGWTVQPEVADVSFSAQGQSETVSFVVHPASDSEPGNYVFDVVVESDQGESSTQVQPIEYDHIGHSYWLKDGKFMISAFPLKTMDDLKVGYIDSGFDQVGQALRQAGIDVEFLDEDSMESGDLSQYDTIVVGIRAYLSREDLLENNNRLKEYVYNGGHVVMQYHKPGDNWSQDLPPYPIQPGSPSIEWRVTDEESPVTMLQPDHLIFHGPNDITNDDFDGWIQERGLYFPSSWDEAYTPLLSMSDPDEEPFKGGLLVANYGEGTYIYTNLVWYRQIQSLVPGSYRMFVNLISYRGDVSANTMQKLVDRFEEEGELMDAQAAYSLKRHLAAVSVYEGKDLADKVVKHMEGFKMLLDDQKDKALISEKAYDTLNKDTNYMIGAWQ